MGDPRMLVLMVAVLFTVPVLHPLLIPMIGVPSHLLWFVHVLPVAMIAYCWGQRAAGFAAVASITALVAAERSFGAGYGSPASWHTAGALAAALAGTHVLVVGFALFARASAARLRALFDGAPIGLLSVGPDGLIVAANPAAVTTLGIAANELRRTSIRTLMGDVVLTADTAGDSAVHNSTIRYERPDGTGAEIEIVRVGALGIAATQLAIRDVTARNAMEARLRQKQKMEALGGLAGGVAHDFNNILSVIGSTADVMLGDTGNSATQQRNDLLTIRSAVDRAAGLVRQLMTFGRRDPAAPGLVCVGEIVGGMETMIRRLAGGRIHVMFSLEESRALVTADRVHIEQIVLNLVTNARDAMPAGGDLTIAVRAGRKDGVSVTTLRVSDTGIGIPEDVRSRMFDPYFTTKTADRGTGLGLATVHSIVRRYGGDIEVRSAPGAGAVFIVSLPQTVPEAWPARGRVAATVPRGVVPLDLEETGTLVTAAVA